MAILDKRVGFRIGRVEQWIDVDLRHLIVVRELSGNLKKLFDHPKLHRKIVEALVTPSFDEKRIHQV